jgi:hypothetical protein
MTRKVKTLSVALVAMLAISALAASAAQATAGEFSWAAGTTKIVKEADPEAPSQLLTITPGAITASFTCDEVSGEATGLTGTGSTSITMQNIVFSDSGTTPEKEVCTGKVNGISVKTPIKFNGCDVKLTADTTVGVKAEGIVEGTEHLECPVGKVIEVQSAGCLLKIGPQTIGRVTYTTKTTPGGLEHVTAHTEIGGGLGEHNNALDYSTSGITCGAHNETDGTYQGTVTFTGFDSSGNPKSVTVT